MTTRSERFELRLSAAELRVLEREAKAAGVPLSEWMRRTALERATGKCPLCGAERQA